MGKVYLCQPTYGAGSPDSHCAFWNGCHHQGSPYRGRVSRVYGGRSLLANTFNLFWVQALNLQLANDWVNWKVEPVDEGEYANGTRWVVRNYKLGLQEDGPFATDAEAVKVMEQLRRDQEVTHFAMLHDDVTPENGWLDILLDTLLEYDADVVSVAVPIKDDAGLTSTAIDDPNDRWAVERRISMTELYRLPEVFSAADCGYPDRRLLINTGCFACRFDRPWRHAIGATEQAGGNITSVLRTCFHIDDRIVLRNGRYVAEVAPEDWNFSRAVQDQGGKVLATRRVKLSHAGMIEYSNRHPWGAAKHDVVYAHKFGGVAIGDEPVQIAEGTAEVVHRLGPVSMTLTHAVTEPVGVS